MGKKNLMGILDNLENSDIFGEEKELPFKWNQPCYSTHESSESTWDKELQFEHQNLAVKIFTETCCHGCSHKSESDHNI
jgi:hypothetical protein